jgi:esterase
MALYSQILGEGTPFIILHGFLGMGDNWKTLGRKFADLGYEVHLVDQRNHGRSFHSEDFNYEVMAEDLLKYFEHHNIRTAILLGHSMGGKTAMQFATDHPDKVSKLIVADIAPKAYPQHHQDILKALQSLNFEKIKSRGEAEEVLSNFIKEEGVRLFLLKNLYWKEKGQLDLRINLKVLAENIDAVGEALAENSEFEGAALFLRGENSGYIDPYDEVLIKKHFPKASIKTISKAGHWVHAENPSEFYHNVMDFL